MNAYPPDRVTKTLTTLVSIAYFGLLAGAILVLVAAPALKLFAGDTLDWTWGLQVPATVADAPTTVATTWGAARLEVTDVRGSLRLPIGMLPWWLVAVLWAHAAVAFALMLLSLHHLRHIFRRVRDGVPFDAHNAQRLRSLGLSLLALALFNGVAELVTALAVRRGLPDGSSIAVPVALPIDGSLVFVACVLAALATVFRRGADLEREQSLVV